ncbi:MAG: outer membrane lipoprotein-sorting protein [bacterium]
MTGSIKGIWRCAPLGREGLPPVLAARLLRAPLVAASLVGLSLLGAMLAATLLAGASVWAQEKRSGDAAALMRRVDELWRGASSHAVLTMTVKTRRYSRAMTMDSWSQGKEKSLVRILSPKKDRGIATLKVNRNIWNYLPKINRITKIPSNMMMGSWMGSHFTNDDLVKESSFETDYQSKITYEGMRNGKSIYEVTSLPRPDAPVVWGKVVTVIERKTLLPLRAVYFDEDGARARTLVFSEPRRFGKRTLPARLELTPEGKPGESTVLLYREINFDVTFPRGLFSLRALRRR